MTQLPHIVFLTDIREKDKEKKLCLFNRLSSGGKRVCFNWWTFTLEQK